MWSGQGPDEPEWYRNYRFWRWGFLLIILALYGGLGVMTQSISVPGIDQEIVGWRAVLVGLLFLFVGAGAIGLLIAGIKRDQ